MKIHKKFLDSTVKLVKENWATALVHACALAIGISLICFIPQFILGAIVGAIVYRHKDKLFGNMFGNDGCSE